MEKLRQKKITQKQKPKLDYFSFTNLNSKTQQNEINPKTFLSKNLINTIYQPIQIDFNKVTQTKKKSFLKTQPYKFLLKRNSSFLIKRSLIYFNDSQKSSTINLGTPSLKKSWSEKQNKQSSFSKFRNRQVIQKYKKKSQKSTLTQKNTLQKNSSNSIKKQYNSFIDESSIENNQNKVEKGEKLYYCDHILKQVEQIESQDNNVDCKKMNAVIKHFFKSISTYYRYQNIKIPDEPHMNVFLPQVRKFKSKNTLIFDMDQTLLHAQIYDSEIHNNNDWGQNFQITKQNGELVKINLKIRPFVREVLERLGRKFQIGIFTAANQAYAREIIKKIDPQGNLFDFCLFRQHCHIGKKLVVKDLRIISNRSIKNVILVDNSPHTFLYQLQNGVPIIDFYDDQKDDWMLRLQEFFTTKKFDQEDDVRPILKQTFQFHKYCDFDDIGEMVDTLYGK